MFKSCSVCGGIHLFSKNKCQKNRYKFKSRQENELDKLRQKNKYRKTANYVKENYYNLCAVCLSEGVLNSEKLEVHHIEKIRERPDLAYEKSNLICLCSQHHRLAEKGELSKEYLHSLSPPGQNFCSFSKK